MKKYLKYIICLLVIIIFIILFLIFKNISKKYSANLFYMDTYINISIVSNDSNKAKLGLEKAEKLFDTYQKLTDRYNSNSELYLLNQTNGQIKVDKKLYELIEYAYNWCFKSNNLFNINMGNVIDVWKKYRDNQNGVPTLEELKNNSIDIKNIVLLDNNTIINNGANIDLGGIAKGYVTKLIGEEFDKMNITDYIINAGGNVLVGTKASNNKYKVGIKSPLEDGGIYQVVKVQNTSVVTSGSYERFYEYDGKKYHHIISPNTLYPTEYMKSVTVICKDSAKADILSTTLFLMTIDDGKEYLKQFDDVEAVWFTNDNQVIKTEGFDKYE